MYRFLLRNQGVALALKGQKSPGSPLEAVCSDHRAQYFNCAFPATPHTGCDE